MSALFCGFAGLGIGLSPDKQGGSDNPPDEILHAMTAQGTLEELPGSRLKDERSIRMPGVRQSGDDVRRKA